VTLDAGVVSAVSTSAEAGASELRAWFVVAEEQCRPDDGPGGMCEYPSLKLVGARSETRSLDDLVLPRPRIYNDSNTAFHQMGCGDGEGVRCIGVDPKKELKVTLGCDAAGKCIVRASAPQLMRQPGSLVVDTFDVPAGTKVVFVKPPGVE
jgi:hypothetical protein